MPTSPELKAQGWVSVTEGLDYFQEPGLVDWKIKVGKKEAKRISTCAMKIGTRVHELVYQEWKEMRYKLSSKDSVEVKNCMQAWEQFKEDYQPIIQTMETELKDEENKVIGHRDMVITFPGTNDIFTVDLKTSSGIKPKHWLQVAKYHHMDYNCGGIGILRLDKNLGVYEWQTKFEDNEELNVFNSLITVYRFFNPTPMESNLGEANGNSSATHSSTDSKE